MPDGIVGLLGLDFHVLGPLPKNEIRKLLLNLDQKFLEIVNGNEEIRQYLKNYPFTEDNVAIALFFRDEKGDEIFDPKIGVAEIAYGKLTYSKFYIDGKNIFRIKDDCSETYQEALDILSKEEKLN